MAVYRHELRLQRVRDLQMPIGGEDSERCGTASRAGARKRERKSGIGSRCVSTEAKRPSSLCRWRGRWNGCTYLDRMT